MFHIGTQHGGLLRAVFSFLFLARILLSRLSLRSGGIPYRLFIQNCFLAHLYSLQPIIESLYLTLVDQMLYINLLFICIL